MITASPRSGGPDSAASRVSAALMVSLCGGQASIDTYADLSALSDDDRTPLFSASAERVFRI